MCIRDSYGFAGRKLVEYIQEAEEGALTERYRELFEQLCHLDKMCIRDRLQGIFQQYFLTFLVMLGG